MNELNYVKHAKVRHLENFTSHSLMDLLHINIIKYISSAWLRFENAKQWILQVKCPPSPHKGVASPGWQVLSAHWSLLVLSSFYHLCKGFQCLVSSFLYFVILLAPHHPAHHQQAKAPTCLHLLGIILLTSGSIKTISTLCKLPQWLFNSQVPFWNTYRQSIPIILEYCY